MKQELARWYTGNLDPHIEKLMKLSNEQLLKIVDFRGLFQLPAVVYLGFVTAWFRRRHVTPP